MTETILPADADIERLPRWAKLAFAARCARRVLPLYKIDWPDAPKKDWNAVWTAVEYAEEHAAKGDYEAYVKRVAEIANPAYHAGNDAGIVGNASVAAMVGRCAYEAVRAGYLEGAVVRAPKAALSATTNNDVIATAIREDYQNLKSLARSGKWDDNTPVSQAHLGDIWQNEWVEKSPGIAVATKRLKALMGKRAVSATIAWRFFFSDVKAHPFPKGCYVEISMPEWDIEEGGILTWDQIRDPHYLNGSLAGVWDDVLKARIRNIRSEAGLAETN